MGLSTENHEKVYRHRRKLIVDNFLGGMAWSVGTLIGGAIILLVIGFIISKINLVPIVGSWLHDVLEEAFKGLSIRAVGR